MTGSSTWRGCERQIRQPVCLNRPRPGSRRGPLHDGMFPDVGRSRSGKTRHPSGAEDVTRLCGGGPLVPTFDLRNLRLVMLCERVPRGPGSTLWERNRRFLPQIRRRSRPCRLRQEARSPTDLTSDLRVAASSACVHCRLWVVGKSYSGDVLLSLAEVATPFFNGLTCHPHVMSIVSDKTSGQ